MSKKHVHPRLNGKHSATIRIGASHHDITFDGAVLDLAKRSRETDKEHKDRIHRTSEHLNEMIFS